MQEAAEADAAMINGHIRSLPRQMSAQRRGGRRGDDQWTQLQLLRVQLLCNAAEADAAMINGHVLRMVALHNQLAPRRPTRR